MPEVTPRLQEKHAGQHVFRHVCTHGNSYNIIINQREMQEQNQNL